MIITIESGGIDQIDQIDTALTHSSSCRNEIIKNITYFVTIIAYAVAYRVMHNWDLFYVRNGY